MMKIIINPNHCKVEDATPQELIKLNDILSVKAEKPWFNKAYRSKKWDGYYRFYNPNNRSFPRGLLSRCLEASVKIELVNSLPPLQLFKSTYKRLKVQARDYQEEALELILNNNIGIIEHATGSGKSVIISLLCQTISDSILIVLPTKTLVLEMQKILKDLGPIGVIGLGQYQLERITLITYASLSNKDYKSDLNKFSVILGDEAHHASATTYYKTFTSLTIPYKFGFSADSKDIHKVKADSKLHAFRVTAAFGPILHRESSKNLTSQGYLSSAKVKLHVLDFSKELAVLDKYSDIYCESYCNNNKLHEKILHILRGGNNAPTIVFCEHLHYLDSLSSYLNNNGINNLIVSGETKTQDLQARLAAFQSGACATLLASDVLSEGFNAPDTRALILAGGGVAPTYQRKGRGLRPKEGMEVIIHDFYIKGNDLIENQCRKRIKIFKAEGCKFE